MKYNFEKCEIIAELSANEYWGVDPENGEIDYSNLLADGGGGEFTNYLCETHGFGCSTWEEAQQHIADMGKADNCRKSRSGYLLGEELTPYLDNNEVLELIKLNDRKAAIHNDALERSKRG